MKLHLNRLSIKLRFCALGLTIAGIILLWSYSFLNSITSFWVIVTMFHKLFKLATWINIYFSICHKELLRIVFACQLDLAYFLIGFQLGFRELHTYCQWANLSFFQKNALGSCFFQKRPVILWQVSRNATIFFCSLLHYFNAASLRNSS